MKMKAKVCIGCLLCVVCFLAVIWNFWIMKSVETKQDIHWIQAPVNIQSFEDALKKRSSLVLENMIEINNKFADNFFVKGEKDMLTDAPLIDVKRAPSLVFSKLKSERLQYALYDDIEVFINMYNGYGRRLKRGGDDIRVWMTSKTQQSGAEVVDLNNGSYKAKLKALWTGSASIHASVTYSREEGRVLLDNRRRLKVLRYTIATFSKQKYSELTICSPFPEIPQYHKICNFTEMNGNPYFCGRPHSSQLSCSNWVKALTINYGKQNMTKEEKQLLSRETRFNPIQQSINISISEAAKVTLPSCNRYNSSLTWTNTAPRGHFHNSVWHPSFCESTLTSDKLKRCILDTSIILIGDSTVRQMYDRITNLLRCSNKTKIGHASEKRITRICEKSNYGLDIKFVIHMFPYSIGDFMDTIHTSASIESRFNHLKPGKKHLIILHLYLHFVFYHTSVFITGVRSLKGPLRRLLKKDPSVKLAIKGPHAFTQIDNKPIVKSDYFGKIYRHILKTELFEFRDRIWFMDFWDMSVCAENKYVHPHPKFVDETAKLFFGFVCD